MKVLLKNLYRYTHTRERITIVSLLILSGSLRLFYAFLFPIEPPFSNDPFYYDRTAKAILRGEDFHIGNLLAYVPPFYHYFLAALYYVSDTNYFFVEIVQVILSTLTVGSAYIAARNLFGASAAALTGILMAIYPQFIRYPTELLSESLYMFLFMCSFQLVTQGLRQVQTEKMFIAGLVLGLAALTREIALYVPILVLLWLVVLRMELGRVIRNGTALLVGVLLIVGPWSVRNYILFDRLIPLATNFGVNVYSGYNPDAKATYSWSVPEGVVWNRPADRYPPGHHEVEAARVSLQEAVRFINERPAAAIGLAAKKLFLFWAPPVHRMGSEVEVLEVIQRVGWLVADVVLVLGSVCAIVLGRKEWRKLFFLVGYVLYINLSVVLTHFESRYRLPAIPMLVMLTAFGLDGAIRSTSGTKLPGEFAEADSRSFDFVRDST